MEQLSVPQNLKIHCHYVTMNYESNLFVNLMNNRNLREIYRLDSYHQQTQRENCKSNFADSVYQNRFVIDRSFVIVLLILQTKDSKGGGHPAAPKDTPCSSLRLRTFTTLTFLFFPETSNLFRLSFTVSSLPPLFSSDRSPDIT